MLEKYGARVKAKTLNNDGLRRLIRPKVSYDFADAFELLIGANTFLGDSGKFGLYGDNGNAVC